MTQKEMKRKQPVTCGDCEYIRLDASIYEWYCSFHNKETYGVVRDLDDEPLLKNCFKRREK